MADTNIDYWGLAEQAMDMAIDRDMMKIAKKEGDPTVVKMLQLLVKYGIYGVKALAFINEFNEILKETTNHVDE